MHHGHKVTCLGAALSRNQPCGKLFFTYNRADLAGGKRKYVFTVPSRRGKKNMHRPIPPRGKIYIGPSRRGKKINRSRPAEGKKLPSRPVVKIYPVGFYRPVPPCHASCSHCTVASRFHFSFPPNKSKLSRPVPSRHDSQSL